MNSTSIKGLLLSAFALGGLALPAQAMCVSPSDPTDTYDVQSWNLCIQGVLQDQQYEIDRLRADLEQLREDAGEAFSTYWQ